MRIRIEASELPGRSFTDGPDAPEYGNVHVGVQRHSRPGELLGLQPGDAASASWTLDCTVLPSPTGVDLRGPYIQGRPGGRFIYLSWGELDGDGGFTMFRRAKLPLSAVAPAVLTAALRSGLLVATLGLTDGAGRPLCASVRPPVVTWSAGGAR